MCECEIYQVCVECVGQEEFDRLKALNDETLKQREIEVLREAQREEGFTRA